MKRFFAFIFCAGGVCRQSITPRGSRIDSDRYRFNAPTSEKSDPTLSAISVWQYLCVANRGLVRRCSNLWSGVPRFKWHSVLFLFMASYCYAGTYTAASCNYSDVNAVVNGPTHTAVDGDVIQIPAGSCTWTSGLTVPSAIGITIIGNGGSGASSGASSVGASAACSSGTTITDNAGGSSIFNFSPAYGNSTTRLSCIDMQPGSTTASAVAVGGTCTSSGCPNLRMDNLTVPEGWSGIGISDDTFAIVNDMFGVADHNTVGGSPPADNGVDFINLSDSSWLGTGQYGDNSWASADTIGTAQTFYLENNSFINAFGTDTDTGGTGGGGGRFACRFNAFSDATVGACYTHGTDTTQRTRGARQVEGYFNVINSCAGGDCDTMFEFRSATGIIFGNQINTTNAYTNSVAKLDAERTWRTDTPWGGCNGTSPWDTNDGGLTPTVYYTGTIGSVSGVGTGSWTITDSGSPNWNSNQWAPNGAPYAFYDVTQGYGIMLSSSAANSVSLVYLCESCISFQPAAGDTYEILRATACIDQPARGAGLLVELTAPVLLSTGLAGAVNQHVDPIYEFDDSGVPNGKSAVASNEGMMMANRDFYSESSGQTAQTSPTSPFNGTSGTGWGTLANRPTTCTAGVGYFATDQGSWNTSGGTNPASYSGQGILYTCNTGGNAWSTYYTPYTYPHPLDGGTSGPTPAAPTNLTATPNTGN